MTASMSNIMSSLKLLFCVVVNTAMFMMVWGMGGRVGRGLGVFLSVAMAVMVKRGFGAFGGKGGGGGRVRVRVRMRIVGAGGRCERRVGKAVVVEKM